MNIHWSMRWEAAPEPEKRDEAVMHTPGQPLDLRAAACMFDLDFAAPLRVWQASGMVTGIPTAAEIALESMRTRTGQAGDHARPFLLQGRPAQGKHRSQDLRRAVAKLHEWSISLCKHSAVRMLHHDLRERSCMLH